MKVKFCTKGLVFMLPQTKLSENRVNCSTHPFTQIIVLITLFVNIKCKNVCLVVSKVRTSLYVSIGQTIWKNSFCGSICFWVNDWGIWIIYTSMIRTRNRTVYLKPKDPNFGSTIKDYIAHPQRVDTEWYGSAEQKSVFSGVQISMLVTKKVNEVT